MKIELTLDQSKKIVAMLAGKKKGVPGMVAAIVTNPFCDEYAALGLSLCIDTDTPFGKKLFESGFIKEMDGV